VIATQIDLESPWAVIALAMSTNDWETLKASRDMSASTERSYMAAYKRLSSGLERSISETGQRTLIKLLPTAALNPNSQASLLNIAIVVKHACGKPTDELVAHREVVQARIAIYKKSRNRIKSETLPTLKELEANADADWLQARRCTASHRNCSWSWDAGAWI